MKKVFIVSESCDGSHYYRAEVFRRYSRKYTVNTNYVFSDGLRIDPQKFYEELFSSDITIYNRPTEKNNLDLIKLLKVFGKIIISDNDDLFSKIDKLNPAYPIRSCAGVNNSHNQLSDGVITTTEYLKKEFEKCNKKVFVVPNYIDFKEYRNISTKKANKSTGSGTRILISGSVLTRENVNEGFIKTLKKIHALIPRTTLIFFGGDGSMRRTLKKMFNGRIECVNGVPISKYPQKLAGLKADFCLIPRKDNFFNRCKSNCKFLEMAALRIPVIAQSFGDGTGPYEKDIKDGINGLLAESNREWQQKIILLAKNRDLRKKIAANAFSYVENNYDIGKNVSRWEEALKKIERSRTEEKLSAANMKLTGRMLADMVYRIRFKNDRDALMIRELKFKIDYMKASKFWRLRSRYMKLKRKILFR